MNAPEALSGLFSALLRVPARLDGLEARALRTEASLERIEATLKVVVSHWKAESMSDMLTTAGAAEVAQVSPETVTEWLREGRLKGSKAPGSKSWRVRRGDLLAFMEGSARESESPEARAETVLRRVK